MTTNRWHTFALLFITLVASSFASTSTSFENTAIVRSVELGGSLVHVTTTYAVKALEAGSNVYTVALSLKDMEKTSWLEAKIKGQQSVLAVSERGLDANKNYHLLDVALVEAPAINSSFNIVLETVQTHATTPWPEQVTQKDEQALKYATELFVLSPYHTSVQRTKLKAQTPRVISFSTPQNLQDFAQDNVATKSGATITYGPFHSIPPSSGHFISEHQQSIVVHYYHDQPLLQVVQLKRMAEISHWGANLNIEDNIHLHNAGPRLKGHFSRLDHQAHAFQKRSMPHTLPSLALHLPPGIRNTYYHDLIGNVSTSRLRVAPAAPKGSRANRYSVMELRPRYPLLGGWNYSFTLGWDAPLGDSASWDAKTGNYIVEIPIMTPIPGAVIEEAEIKVILPEGATDVDFSPPFPAVANWITTHTTYLDSIGRPAIIFKYKNLTVMHARSIFVSYKVPLSAHLRKPFTVAVACFSLFALALIGRRIDLTINKKKVL